MAKKSTGDETSSLRVRCLVQQCLSARLQTRLPDPDNGIEPEFVQIDRGVVLFVCFLKDAQESDVDKLVKMVLNVRLSECLDNSDSSKHVSVLDLPGSILIIPQATLGGRIKGKMIQYHGNIGKETGLVLYDKFIELCRQYSSESAVWREKECKVVHGTYGIRQVYSTETNGPYLHMIEF